MAPLAYFVRHGQTDWNVELRLQGQADVDMNEVGRAQASAIGARLARRIADPSGFDYVASPLRRTRETMELIRRELGLAANSYRVDPRLLEVHFGDWQGFTFEELERIYPGAATKRSRDKWGHLPPGKGAESYELLAERVRGWLEDLDRPTVCVTHGGVMRAIFLLIGGVTRAQAETMVIPQDRALRVENGRFEWL